jgi:nucleoside triphosphate diphosphatase
MPEYPDRQLRALWATIERLLDKDGCPWDREQRAPDLARHLIEEGHEWLEACDQNNTVGQTEELGDLSYLMLFALQRLAADGGDPATALTGIDAKLRRRHPHIFPDEAAAARDESRPADSDEQLGVWEAVKRAERAERGEAPGLLKPLPRSMGALSRSHRYQEKAAGAGFDWPDRAGVQAKLDEELAELNQELTQLPADTPAGAGPPSRRYRRQLDAVELEASREELGDLLFVIANLCRWLGLDAEEVAEAANAKFLRRFAAMESRLAATDRPLADCDLEEMERAWQSVKASERE